MLKRPCHYFNSTGKCRFGKHCKFLHSIDIPQQQIDTESQQDGILNSKSPAVVKEELGIQEFYPVIEKIQDEGLNKKKEVALGVKVGRILCKFYSERKFCQYGNRCRYAHVLPDQEKVEDGNDLKGNLEGCKESIESDVQNEVEKDQEVVNQQRNDVKKAQHGKKLCRFFIRGYCRLGSRCHFYHPKPTDGIIKEKGVPSSEGQTDVPKVDGDADGWRPVVKPKFIYVYQRADVTEEKLTEMRETELKQLKRRFPADKLRTISETDENAVFIFTFFPSDPDWPFDVNAFDIQVEFDQKYPLKIFKPSMSLDQDLPATVLRYIEVSLQEWVVKKEEECMKKGIVELFFRPFLRWMDRNMEAIVTEGLKQLQRELQAQAAGLQFIPAKDLKKDTPTEVPEGSSGSFESSDMMTEKDNRRPVVYRKGDYVDEVYEVPTHDSCEDSHDESSDDNDDDAEEDVDNGNDNVHTRPVIDPDTSRSGTEVSLKNMQIWYLTTMLMEKLKIIVQCERCKNKTDFSTPPNRVNSVVCSKCSNVQLVVFRPVLAHAYSSTVGYLDLEGCTAFDVILQDCHLSIGCVRCSRDALVKKFVPGRQTEVWCRGCHMKMKFSCDSIKLSLLTLDGIDSTQFSGRVHKVNVCRNQRVLKDPAIREGFPLPNEGACKHYKKSFRWLRFPCCGKTYPCDICHDDKEDHEMKYANRMICGFCCKEQPFAADKPCSGCSSALTKVRTSHWEGGRGCRDKISMSRADGKKYTNINKTVSNKAKATQEKNKGKKVTKLRHT